MSTSPRIIDQLTPSLFWDVDMDTLRIPEHSRFIITRVMERGTLDDVYVIWNAIDHEEIKAALTEARTLDPRTVAFFANQFGIPKNAFRAHRRRMQCTETTWL